MLKVHPDEGQAGALDFLIKQTVDVLIEKATQKRIDEEPKGDGAEPGEPAGEDPQGGLPNIVPLIPNPQAAAEQAEAANDPTAAAALEALDRADATAEH